MSKLRPHYESLFTFGPRMRTVQQLIEQVAATDATILMRGESGVGKDVVARAIHLASERRDHPFVKVNCAALPGELLESELFGHEKGAFTGAYRRKPGKFEFASKGTIFLDEIGELPLPLQAKLLHVLQDFEFSRIGGREMIRVESRIIASTNRDLEVAISKGQFREDLYYRLHVVEVALPPLRERREEIPGLASAFLDRFNQEYGRHEELKPEVLAEFMRHRWPGNIRELENAVRRLVVLGGVSLIREVVVGGLPRQGAATEGARFDGPPDSGTGVDAGLGLKEIARRAAQEAERQALAAVLERVRWNRIKAARILKVSYKTLLTKIAECGLVPDRPRRRILKE
jgi:two-component system, NtrC family, response regulator AtoC